MSIPYNPSLTSPNPETMGETLKRIVMNPPQSYLDSVAAQNAIEAGQQPVPQSNGPIAFGPDGQAILVASNNDQSSFSTSSNGSNGSNGGPDLVNNPNPGMPGAAMGMGVNTPDQKGLDPSVMKSIQQQIASGIPSNGISASAVSATLSSPLPSVSASSASLSMTASLTASASVISSLSASILSTAPAPSSSNSLQSSSTSATSSSSELTSATSSPEAASSVPFLKSTAFILLLVFSILVVLIIIGTTLSWIFKWKGKDGTPKMFGGLCCFGKRRKGDDEENDHGDDDLSDYMRNFSQRGSGSSGYGGNNRRESDNSIEELMRNGNQVGKTYNPYIIGAGAGGSIDGVGGLGIDEFNGLEKRSSLLAEDVNSNAPFLHSGLDGNNVSDRVPEFKRSSVSSGIASTNINNHLGIGNHDEMEDIDLNDEKGYLPGVPVINVDGRVNGDGSPRAEALAAFGSRLEVRNKSEPDGLEEWYGDRARTLPRSWATDRSFGSSFGGGISRSKSTTSNTSSSARSSGSRSLVSPFSSTASNRSNSRSSNRPPNAAWPRRSMTSDSHHTMMTSLSMSDPPIMTDPEGKSSTWASSLRNSLLAAINISSSVSTNQQDKSEMAEDKFTRPILPMHLSRTPTQRSNLTSISESEGSSTTKVNNSIDEEIYQFSGSYETFGKKSGGGGGGLLSSSRGLMVLEENEQNDDDCYSITSSAKRDIENALLADEIGRRGSEKSVNSVTSIGTAGKTRPLNVVSKIGGQGKWKRYDSGRLRGIHSRDEVDFLC